jgi:lipopolysaccharide biosynthesis regulator YciM
MDTDTLRRLRDELLQQLEPMLDSADLPVDDKYRLALRLAQSKNSSDLYDKAFRVAQQLEGDDKLAAYLDLLGDVDYLIEEAPSPSQDANQ